MGKKPSATKRAIQLLAICKDRCVNRKIIERSPDSVIKTLCNVALNAERGDIKLSPGQKKLFGKHRGLISKLTNKKLSLATKRKIIQKGGIWPILIPALISAVIGTLGSAIFK